MFQINTLEEQISDAKRHLAYFTQQIDYMFGRKAYWEKELFRIGREYDKPSTDRSELSVE